MTHAAFVFPISAILVLTVVPAPTVHAQHWQQFRGPRPKRGQTDQVQLSQHSLRLVPLVGAPGGRTSSSPA